MKRREGFYSIRYKMLAAYVVLLFVTSVGVFCFFTFRFDKVYKQQANSHMADVTGLAAANVSNMMEQIDQLSVSVIVDRAVQENLGIINKNRGGYDKEKGTGSIETNKAAISNQIRGSIFNINGITSLRIYSLSGEEIFIGTTNREFLEYSFGSDEIYEANGGALWSLAGDANYVCMCRAILSTANMKPLGYMVIICQNDYFGDEFSTVSSAYSGRVYLVDQEGETVCSSDQELIGSIFPYEIQELRERKQSTIEDPGTGEKSYYYTGETLENGWTLICTVSAKQFRDGVAASILQMGLLLAGALILSFIVTTVVVRRLVGPTKKLLLSMSEFGEGKLDSRVEVSGNDEIGQIGCAYNEMADNIQNLMEKVYSLELANKEAEIEFLKMQINPHFLYNSLDTISWLGFTGGNEKVSDLAVSLAKLLRASIQRADMITVAEEMETVKSYLLIQDYRFGDKIGVEYDVASEVLQYYMPSFLLQPLIENSIIHGLENQIEKGILKISIKAENDWLMFVIVDDGRGMEQKQVEMLLRQCKDSQSGNAIGLKNVYRRLQLLYGEESSFEIKSVQGKGTSISFRIPVTRWKPVAEKP
ncbi:cache domain-containing sensor histidine kinase [Muricomes intestini]|jgi:sensor histidine kinase YesM|uniref:histidine kinase n=1 Tax=Muricomes intestini TaxID=1796634 RepID=A0A4R3JZT1_9FIRM|nr:sensor histidine kinase [Muricomes intestini]TCS74706.1 two-component system sensor histidine kinase YesM [Muricomes intestini]HAX51401.1 hypothetical protein [Lachnospiraceae bacterium]HCR82368.1 hypothetical protein [Lachnospiraceae bacterium]